MHISYAEYEFIEEIGMSKAQKQMTELSNLMRTKLGVRGKSLSAQIERATRRFPRRLRRDLEPFILADSYQGHPRLMQTLDQGELDMGFERLQAHLLDMDLSGRRTRRFKRAMGSFMINMVIILSLLYAVLRWREFV